MTNGRTYGTDRDREGNNMALAAIIILLVIILGGLFIYSMMDREVEVVRDGTTNDAVLDTPVEENDGIVPDTTVDTELDTELDQ